MSSTRRYFFCINNNRFSQEIISISSWFARFSQFLTWIHKHFKLNRITHLPFFSSKYWNIRRKAKRGKFLSINFIMFVLCTLVVSYDKRKGQFNLSEVYHLLWTTFPHDLLEYVPLTTESINIKNTKTLLKEHTWERNVEINNYTQRSLAWICV